LHHSWCPTRQVNRSSLVRRCVLSLVVASLCLFVCAGTLAIRDDQLCCLHLVSMGGSLLIHTVCSFIPACLLLDQSLTLPCHDISHNSRLGGCGSVAAMCGVRPGPKLGRGDAAGCGSERQQRGGDRPGAAFLFLRCSQLHALYSAGAASQCISPPQ
jgi:hypothetical protein